MVQWFVGLSIRRLEFLWLDARSISISSCFFSQEIIVHIVCLHPGVEIGTMTNCCAAPAVVY